MSMKGPESSIPLQLGSCSLDLALRICDYNLETNMSEMLAVYFAHREGAYERLCILVENARAGVSEQPRFPVGACKHCGKPVTDTRADGKTILFCSYACYCMD